MSASSFNYKLYTSRLILLDILHTNLNMNISEYDTFSTMEIDAMRNENALDILLEYRSTDTQSSIINNTIINQPQEKAPMKIYIKYYLKSTLNDNAIKPLIEDLFYAQSPTLKKEDTLIIVFDGEPSDLLKEVLKLKYEQDGIFIVVHNIARLLYNILKHSKQPAVQILSQHDTDDFYKNYHISPENAQSELPTISRFDPVSLVLCLRPKQVVKFMRKSPTAVETPYYRICD